MDSIKGLSMAPPTTPQSGPQRVKPPLVPTTPPYPSTRHVITPSTPDRHLSSSVPTSPYTGLTDKQVKNLENAFAKTDSKIEYTKEILEMVRK